MPAQAEGCVSRERCKDFEWTIERLGAGATAQGAQLTVLMDLRDELKRLNGLLFCRNFVDLPRVLRAIRKNTTRPKRMKMTARTHLLTKRRTA